MNETYLTLNQALHLLVLVPCITVALFLLTSLEERRYAMIPALYFLVLAINTAEPLLPFLIIHNNGLAHYLSLVSYTILPAISFLLMIQFLYNHLPPLWYWSVLAIPLLGSSPFIYANLLTDELCFGTTGCVSSYYILYLTHIIFSSFIFMLAITALSRLRYKLDIHTAHRNHKYWIIFSLILCHLCLLIADIFYVTQNLSDSEYVFSQIMVKFAFIYIILSSIFRVFSDMFDWKTMPYRKTLTAWEDSVAQKAITLITEQKIYKDMDFSRDSLAKRLGIREYLLSRVINKKFQKNLSEIANDYRVHEAKTLLQDSQLPITEIAFDVGFNSITTFNRVFKDYTGQSPSNFRKRKKTSL